MNPISIVIGILLLGCVAIPYFFASLEPTEIGLAYNKLTGYVDTSRYYEGGLHFMGPTIDFIRFPASAVTLEFSSDETSMAPPIDARTGADNNDPDSGGQPIRMSLSIILKLKPERIGDIYRSFSTAYIQRYVQYTRQAISDVAQRHEPTQFWTEREVVARDMQRTLKEILGREGGAELLRVQILRIEFSSKFEQSVINIQVATQARITSEYQQQVMTVRNDIDILSAQTNATIATIEANAQAKAKLLVVEASAQAFNNAQTKKARAYRSLTRELGLSNDQLVEFLRVKAIRAHRPESLVLGMESPIGRAAAEEEEGQQQTAAGTAKQSSSGK